MRREVVPQGGAGRVGPQRPLQHLQVDEGLSMPLGITQAKEGTSGASGMPRGSMLILIDYHQYYNTNNNQIVAKPDASSQI